jgi:transcriptional regulator with XRE-family HTH domain
MQVAIQARDMGRVMWAFRTHPHHGRNISQEVAAGWVGLTQPRLSRIENGSPVTNLSQLIRWANILGLPPNLRWFEAPTVTTTPQDEATTTQPERRAELERPSDGPLLLPVLLGSRPVLMPLDRSTLERHGLGATLDELVARGASGSPIDADLQDTMSPLSRRSLLTHDLVAAALPDIDLGELDHVTKAVEDARRYFDGPVVDYFRQQIASCMAGDGVRGPRKTLPLMLGLLGAIEESAHDVKPAVRRELLCVGAQGAEFCAWLYRDLRDLATAGTWHDRGMEWAQEARDYPMQAYLLMKKSQMAYDERGATRVLSLAQAAQHGPWELPVKVRAEITQQEALGMAMVGEPMPKVEHKLDEAQQLLAKADGEEQPGVIGSYFTETTLRLRNASCYTEAGKPGRAAELFGEVLAADQLSRRDAGYFQSRRASALALSGEPDEAAAVGLESAAVAKATNSQRTVRVLREVVRTLEPWRSRPGPHQLREALKN